MPLEKAGMAEIDLCWHTYNATYLRVTDQGKTHHPPLDRQSAESTWHVLVQWD